MRRTAPLWAIAAISLFPLTAARTHAQTQPVATGGSVITQTESAAGSSWTRNFLERLRQQYVPSVRQVVRAPEWQRARLLSRTPGPAFFRRDRIRLP